MEESVILHRLESRTPSQKVEAIEELTGLVRDSAKLHFSNKLSLFSSFKRILQDDDLLLRTKCTKLVCDILPKLGSDLDTCMSFVMPNIMSNMAAANLVLKRESIKLIRCFSGITSSSNQLVRCIIWEGIDNKDTAIAKEVILNLTKLIPNILQTEDCYDIVAALCKRYYLEENKKVKKALRESFSGLTGIVGLSKMEDLIQQLPTSAISSAKELLTAHLATDKPKVVSYKSSNKLEVDSAISLEGSKLLWDLIPESTLTRLHGDDIVEQLKAISELEMAIRRVTNPADFLICIDEICEAIIKVIPINNFRVFKSSTTLVSAFVDVFSGVLGDCVYPLTRVLCHKIGDNKIAVREGTMKCLTQLMSVCGPTPVLDVVLASFRDRNPRQREEAINVVIKTILTFPLHEINVGSLLEYLAAALADPRQKVANTALEGIVVLAERLPARDQNLIYRAVEKIDSTDRRYYLAVRERLEQGSESGLVTQGEGYFSRNTTITGSLTRMSNHSVSLPTTSQERASSKDGLSCPPTPLSLPRRYYSAGRNRLPWEKTSRQNTIIHSQGGEEQFASPRAAPERNVFIKGGGARTDGGSYAQMHLRKKQQLENEQDGSSPRTNTLGSLKKYFPTVRGSPDPKRSWPSVSKVRETESNGSGPPSKANSFTNDSYGVQNSSMYESYRVTSGESSGVGTLTNNTPNGSAQRFPHFSPPTALNDSGIFEEQSFSTSKLGPPSLSTRPPSSGLRRSVTFVSTGGGRPTSTTQFHGLVPSNFDDDHVTNDDVTIERCPVPERPPSRRRSEGSERAGSGKQMMSREKYLAGKQKSALLRLKNREKYLAGEMSDKGSSVGSALLKLKNSEKGVVKQVSRPQIAGSVRSKKKVRGKKGRPDGEPSFVGEGVELPKIRGREKKEEEERTRRGSSVRWNLLKKSLSERSTPRDESPLRDNVTEEERAEQARWEKIRKEERGREERRRVQLRAQLARENDAAEEAAVTAARLQREQVQVANGYVELALAKKKLKQAAEDARKSRPKLIKTRTRTESLSLVAEPDPVDIDIVGRGLKHVESSGAVTKDAPPKDRTRLGTEEKTPAQLRAPSGVYGQRCHPTRSPDESSLSDNSDPSDEEEDDDSENGRSGYPVGSGLSAATRMRFEKKKALYVERQSAEQRPPSYQTTDHSPAQKGPGKPVSAPVESRTNVKRSPPRNKQERAHSLRPSGEHQQQLDRSPGGDADGVQNTSLVDEKEATPLNNPDAAANEAIKCLKIGGEEWNLKVQGLHLLRRLARHHPDNFTADLITYSRLTCEEVANLRSTVSRLAIQITGDYCVMLKSAMDPDIERIVECLLSKSADMNNFIRNDILVSLGKVVENVTPHRTLVALINHGASHKNAAVRSISAQCFRDVTARMSVAKCLGNKDLTPKFLNALERFCYDGNQETRYYGRLVLSSIMHSPGFDAICQKHLSPRAARNLRDMCDKLNNKGVGSLPSTLDRTSGRNRSSNLSATFPGQRSRKASPPHSSEEVAASPRVTRRAGPRRDVRDLSTQDRMPPSLYENLNSANWQDRFAGIAELRELSVRQTHDVKQSILRISDAFTPRLKDPNSKVNLYALQCLLQMVPLLESSLDQVLTPFTEQLVPNLASQRANIVTLTSQILDGFRLHVDNSGLLCEFCRIMKGQTNPRIKPIILDKISDMVRGVYESRPKLVEQVTLPVLTEYCDSLDAAAGTGPANLGSYVGRLASLLHGCMGGRLYSEISRTRPSCVATIREYLAANT